MATIKDVAKLADVSISTASVALNGKGPVSDVTRLRVVDAARQLQYRPNAIARGLVTRRTRTVGLILPDITDPYFHEIAKGVEGVVSASDYTVVLADTDRSPEKESRSIEALRSHQVDGLILAGSGIESENHLVTLEGEKVLVVAVGRHHIDLPSVAVDNVAAARIVTEHLLEYGYRRIAFVAGPSGLTASEDRYAGFLQAMERYHLKPDPIHTLEGDFTPAGGCRAVGDMLRRSGGSSDGRPDGPAWPEAILAGNDQMAVGAMKAVKEFGFRIPQHIAVAGIGDIPTAVYVDPPLTTVALPMKRMGEEAARMLLALLEGKPGVKRRVRLQVELRVRASTRRK